MTPADLDPSLVKQTAPGVVGALGSVFFMKGPLLLRFGMVIPGGALAYYGVGAASPQVEPNIGNKRDV